MLACGSTRGRFRLRTLILLLPTLTFCLGANAASEGTIRGIITDPLGAAVSNAEVVLLRDGTVAARTRTGKGGEYGFDSVAPGRYRVRVSAPGFATAESGFVYSRRGETARVPLALDIGPLHEHMVVSATGQSTPQSRVGASVDVIGPDRLRALGKIDVLDALRFIPGVQVEQEGQRGGVTSVFVRGGNYDFNKVLIDGVPANEIGGQFDFANLASSGVDEIEVFRSPDSILYGSDALASVIRITTRRGSTPEPQFSYSADGGNFHSLRQEASLGGVLGRLDYFSDFMRFDTQNSLPNSSFHNATYAGNFGWAPLARTRLRFTVHHDATGLGSPNALAEFGIPDDSFQREQDTELGLTLEDQTTPRWHNQARFTSMGNHYFFDTPEPAGIAVTSTFGTNYAGLPVNLCGANGYCASGQAILDYGPDSGAIYPALYNARSAVRAARFQSSYDFTPAWNLTAGFQYTHESGFNAATGSAQTNDVRNNEDGFIEGHGSIWQRAFAAVGVGLEQNTIFGFAATPRASLAWYAHRPSAASAWGRTKLRFNFGEGIQEPSIYDEGASLYTALAETSGGPALIRQYGISPLGAERSRSFDAGVEQGLWNERALASVTLFHERFYDLFEFVPGTALPLLGISTPVAAALPFGAEVNSDSFRSEGAEAELRARIAPNLAVTVGYTYLDAVVTRSFSSDAFSPSFNPAFPNIPIGAYAPLVGARPFRRPPQTGNFVVSYSRRRFGLSLSGYMVSRSDDTTALTDTGFGTTLLLPNRDLLAGYQLLGFSGWYDVARHVTFYTSMGNLLSEHYQAAFGYPALPFNFRAGVRFTIGGERK